MFGLTSLGLFHTVVSLLAVAGGVIALVRQGSIRSSSGFDMFYIVTTLITVVTGFGIFEHGGFGAPHALGVLTLVTMAIAVLAGRRRVFGNASESVETVAYSATMFFHMIPGVTETATRLPLGAPLLPSPDAPELKVVTAVMFILFLAGAAYQVRQLRVQPASLVA